MRRLSQKINIFEDGSTIHDVAKTIIFEEDDLGWPIAL